MYNRVGGIVTGNRDGGFVICGRVAMYSRVEGFVMGDRVAMYSRVGGFMMSGRVAMYSRVCDGLGGRVCGQTNDVTARGG